MSATKGLYVLPNNGYVPCEDAVILRFNLNPGDSVAGFAMFYTLPTSPRNITDVRLAQGDNSQFYVYKIAVTDPPPSNFANQVALETDVFQQWTPVQLSAVKSGNANVIRIQPAVHFSNASLRMLK